MSLGAKFKNFFFTKKFLVNLGLLILTYVVIVFVLNIYLDSYTDHGEKIAVPNLIGKNQKQFEKVFVAAEGLVDRALDFN